MVVIVVVVVWRRGGLCQHCVYIYSRVVRGNTAAGAVAETALAAVVICRSEQAAETRESADGSEGGIPRFVTAPRHRDPNTFIGHGAATARLAGARIVLVTVTVLHTQSAR